MLHWKRLKNAGAQRALVKAVMQPSVGKVVSRAICGPARGVDFAVRFDDRPLTIDFANALTQVADELVQGVELFLSGLFLIEVADEADAEGDVVEVVAVDMAAIDLAGPSAANFDFSVARGGAVADHKLIGKAVGHFAHIRVVEFKGFGIALAGAAVVHHDVAPAGFLDGSAVDLFAKGFWQVPPTGEPPKEGGGLEASFGVKARFFDYQRRILFLCGSFRGWVWLCSFGSRDWSGHRFLGCFRRIS